MALLAALLFICFAAHGVSSASIHQHTDVEWEEEESPYMNPTVDEIKNAVDFDPETTLSEAFNFPLTAANIATCFSYYSKDIQDVAREAQTVFGDVGRLVAEVLNKVFVCGNDLNCKIGEILNGASKLLGLYSEVRKFVVNFKVVADKYLTCTRDGVPTPAPPTTRTTTTTEAPLTTFTTSPATSVTTPGTETTYTPTESTVGYTTSTPSPSLTTQPERFEFDKDKAFAGNSDSNVRPLKFSGFGIDRSFFYSTTRPRSTTRRF